MAGGQVEQKGLGRIVRERDEVAVLAEIKAHQPVLFANFSQWLEFVGRTNVNGFAEGQQADLVFAMRPADPEGFFL